MAGDPGSSKSALAIDICARIASGADFPDGEKGGIPGSVIYITGEDDPADTIVPRFIAASGDLSKLHILTYDFSLDDVYLKKLEHDLHRIGDVRLIVIDPITQFLGRISNSIDTGEVRKKLAPLGELLARWGLACIAISHLNKDQTMNAIYRTTGSLAFVAFARSVYLVLKDPDDDSIRLFLPAKYSVSPEIGGLAYELETAKIADGIETVRIAWGDARVSVSPDEVLGQGGGRGNRASTMNSVVAWLESLLESGPIKSKAIWDAAKEEGISKSTLDRAKKRLLIESEKVGGPGEGKAYWIWKLPNA